LGFQPLSNITKKNIYICVMFSLAYIVFLSGLQITEKITFSSHSIFLCFCILSTVCIVKQQKLHKFTSIGRLPSTAVFCIHFFCWPHSCHVEICIEFNLLNYSTNISFLCPFLGLEAYSHLYVYTYYCC
jgi:hypothetical protein